MSFLGSERFNVEGFPGKERLVDRYKSINPSAGCLATTRSDGAHAVLCYNKPEIRLNNGLNPQMEPDEKQKAIWLEQSGTVSVSMSGIQFEKVILTEIRVDGEHGNPYALYKEWGAPDDITSEQYTELLTKQEPVITGSTRLEIEDGSLEVKAEMQGAALSLFIVEPDSKVAPYQIGSLDITLTAGSNRETLAVLDWSREADASLAHYEVYYSEEADGYFRQINKSHLFDRSFTHVIGNKSGFYKVRAVGLNGQAGQFSPVAAVKSDHF